MSFKKKKNGQSAFRGVFKVSPLVGNRMNSFLETFVLKSVKEKYSCIAYKIWRKATFQNFFLAYQPHFGPFFLRSFHYCYFFFFSSHVCESILSVLYIFQNA